MIAQCTICGQLLPDKLPMRPGSAPQELFGVLSFSAFLHLVERHPEQIQSALNPMMGAVSNYLASLTLRTSHPHFERCQKEALADLLRLLSALTWSDAVKQFTFAEAEDGPVPPVLSTP
jgi:hypothetical protein